MELNRLYICDGYYYLPTMHGLTFFDSNGKPISIWSLNVYDEMRVVTVYCVLLQERFERVADEWFKLVKQKYEIALYTVREGFRDL